MGDQMMQPSMWANGVQQPNYAQELMDFSALPKIGEKLGQKNSKPKGAGPLQLTPGAGQAQPQNIGGNFNAMANTANATPWASKLMQMFGGQGMQAMAAAPSGPSLPMIGGTNPLGGSGIY